MTPHHQIFLDVEKYADGISLLLNSRKLYEAAIAEPGKYPALANWISTHTEQSTKRMISYILLYSGKWERWNCGAGSRGTWLVVKRTDPDKETLADEIARVVGTRNGISMSMLWDSIDRPDCPLMAELAKGGFPKFRNRVIMIMKIAGYIRRSRQSLYWMAPEETK